MSRCCCWSSGSLDDPLLQPSPFSYADLQRGHNIIYRKKPDTEGGYPAKGTTEASIVLRGNEISLRLRVKAEFVELFSLVYLRLNRGWLDGMYPTYCIFRDETDATLFYCIHDIEEAIEELQTCTRLSQRDSDVIRYLTGEEASALRSELRTRFNTATVLCEQRRYNSFDNLLTQYPIYKVFIFPNSEGDVLIEVATHSGNQEINVSSSLSRYNMTCENANVSPKFSFETLRHIISKERRIPIGRIRIRGDITEALHYLSTTSSQYSETGYVYAWGDSKTAEQEASLNPNKVQEIIGAVIQISATQALANTRMASCIVDENATVVNNDKLLKEKNN